MLRSRAPGPGQAGAGRHLLVVRRRGRITTLPKAANRGALETRVENERGHALPAKELRLRGAPGGSALVSGTKDFRQELK